MRFRHTQMRFRHAQVRFVLLKTASQSQGAAAKATAPWGESGMSGNALLLIWSRPPWCR